MAEHRRVEPHIALVGTGMAVDGERIAALEDEAERRARAWREAPERGFGDVLQTAPARGHLEDEEEPDPRRRPKVEAAERAGLAADALNTNDAARPGLASGPRPKPNLPRVPPDPRQALLDRKLAAARGPAAPAAAQSVSVLPPTPAPKPTSRNGPAVRDERASEARPMPAKASAASAPADRAPVRPKPRSTAPAPASTDSPNARSRAPAPIALDDVPPESTPPTGKTGRPH